MGRILLAGGSALMPCLAGYFASQLGRPVEVGNPLRHIVGTSWAPKLPPILFTNVIGLALRGLDGRRDIDLTSRTGFRARWPILFDIALSARLGLVVAALAVLVLAMALLMISRYISRLS
ncbi:MAG: hypothetical protein AAB692_02400, partial [Patescibacteria group bacterium]